ncbi:dTDP-4-dehydrorhamnose 3,5-epimerase [Pseudooctadecabacter sp.]|uniref:dTDP-4-dehydrorhamnose 3,5-epimerase n=1 Tax=Pseudooctadecabacter sp. TaxID=1966338 RepID=UPI003F6D93EA
MRVEATELDGVLTVEPERFSDGRGFFSEVYNQAVFHAAGIEDIFVQDNHSLSEQVGTVRGMHYQAPPHGQAKLVRCGRGAIWDVVVDFRAGSSTYGAWFGCELTAQNGRQLYVPEGFLHGFITLEPMTEVLYKCSAAYAPEADGAVAWDSLGIEWPLEGRRPVVSDKDANAPRFADVASPFEGLL